MNKTISKMKRIEDAKQARSEAINRFMADCQEEARLAKQDMRFYVSMASFFCLIAFSALAGLNA